MELRFTLTIWTFVTFYNPAAGKYMHTRMTLLRESYLSQADAQALFDRFKQENSATLYASIAAQL